MTQPSKPSKPSTAPVVPDDWPAQAAERIEDLVGTVRDKTTGPVMAAARWAVYGALMLIVGIAAIILLTTMVLRFLQSYLPFGDANVWVSYLILGAITTTGGLVLLGKAKQPAEVAK
ncbi:MAG TPA: hypothetical protein VMW08_06990 [Acidimicrobiales bacterium]|nr:hypothetical protein [Acidimicrobiales bacterium]